MATYTSNYAWTKPSGGDPVDIEVLNDNLDDQDSIVHQAFLDLAPVFSTANTYAVKDVVLYDNKVWICHTAVTTAGAWTGSTNWTQTTVGETGGVAKYADLPDKPSINGNELSGNKTGAQLGLQNALTFDNVPTANSTNPVKSGGVYASDEAIRKWTTAEAKSASGNPITLLDGSARNAEGLAVTCNPKQNLHGYDHPWAGGAGKNKLPMTVDGIKALNVVGTWSGNTYTVRGVSFQLLTDEAGNITGVKATGTASSSVATITLDVTPDLDSNTSYVLNGCPTNGGANTYNIQYSNMRTYAYEDFGDGVTVRKFDYSTYPNAQIAVNIAGGYAIPSGGLIFYPMIRLASVSDATFEPYSNICPITGLTECVVDRVGFNIWDGTTILGKVVKCTDGTEMVDAGYDCTDFIPVISNTPYYFNVYSAYSAQLRGMAWYDENKNYISGVPAPRNTKYGLITSPSNAKYVRCSLEKQYEDNACINISDPSKDGTYEPYQSTTATITFGQTVYGGTVNFKTGKVTVDRVYLYVDGSDTSILGVATGQLQIAISSDSKTTTDIYHKVGDLLCNRFDEIYNNSSATDGIYYRANGSHNLLVRGNNYTAETTLSDWVTWLGNNPLQIVYGLATPTELTLTPAELELLKGYNYITTNGTTIALAYLPDSLLAEAENYVDAVASGLGKVQFYAIQGHDSISVEATTCVLFAKRDHQQSAYNVNAIYYLNEGDAWPMVNSGGNTNAISTSYSNGTITITNNNDVAIHACVIA